MRSTNKSSTLRNTFEDNDGNKHDSVVSGSIITRDTGYDARVTLMYPFQSTSGSQQDAVVKRGSVSVNTFLPLDAEDLPVLLLSFFAVAKRLDLIDNQTWNIDTADVWAELTADFTKMIANIVTVPGGNAKKVDRDSAHIVTNAPEAITGTN